MASGWQIVAFPLILPWREEFWTLPVYFPDLLVGVIQGWPPQLPYLGIPLPPEAEPHPQELKHYRPGDLLQWRAFKDFQEEQGEGVDLLQAIRRYGEAKAPDEPPAPNEPPAPAAWSLAWQLEKMEADQDAQMLLVDRGQDWLNEILTPEPWEDKVSFGPVPGVSEMVDPDLARLRYRLWLRVLAPYLREPWTPLLLGRTSRSLFLTLKGWPDWTGLRKVQIPLPGCRTAAEWLKVAGETGAPPWLRGFQELLAALLAVAAQEEDLGDADRRLKEFVEDAVMARWPCPAVWRWDLEIWLPDTPGEEEGPVLCWGGAGAGVLPG
jgi:hypothetical protein